MPTYDDARDFRERVRFERRRQNGDDGYGNVQYEWQTVAGPMAARIRQTGGAENVQAVRLQGTGIFEITVRSSKAVREINAADRCVNHRSGTAYNIRFMVNEDERNQFVTLTCESGVAT